LPWETGVDEQMKQICQQQAYTEEAWLMELLRKLMKKESLTMGIRGFNRSLIGEEAKTAHFRSIDPLAGVEASGPLCMMNILSEAIALYQTIASESLRTWTIASEPSEEVLNSILRHVTGLINFTALPVILDVPIKPAQYSMSFRCSNLPQLQYALYEVAAEIIWSLCQWIQLS
jgi:hypothetical protein